MNVMHLGFLSHPGAIPPIAAMLKNIHFSALLMYMFSPHVVSTLPILADIARPLCAG